MTEPELKIAGGGFPLAVDTYDFLCIISHELQASSPVVNAVARVASALFPDKIEYVERGFIPNMWMNRVMVQTATGQYLMLDANIWHDTYYYLVNFSGVDLSKFRYDSKENIAFPQWFEAKVQESPTVLINTEKNYTDIPRNVTREYVDIVNRLSISIYVLDAFGSSPRETIRQNMQNQSQPVQATTDFKDSTF